MSYFTPAQEYFRGLMGVNTQRMFPNNVLQGLPQMPPQSMAPAPMGPAPMAAAPQNPMPQAAPSMPQQDNPITKGLTAGMQTARDSIDWDEDQKSQMMGLAIAKMFGGLSANQGQHPTVLGGLNAGLKDAVNSMGDERERIWRMNKMQLDRQDMMEKELQRRLERQEEMDFKRQVHQDEMGFKNKELASGMTPYQQRALALRERALALKEGPEYNPDNFIELGNGEDAVDLSKVNITKYKPFVDKKSASEVAKARVPVDLQLKLAQKAKALYEDYVTLKSKGFTFNPQDPITRTFADKFYEITGQAFNDKEMKNLTNTSVMINALYGRLRAMQERALEGGRLMQGLTKYYEKMGLYADPKHMNDAQVLQSTNMMIEDLADENLRLELANATGRNLTLSEAKEILKEGRTLSKSNRERVQAAKEKNPALNGIDPTTKKPFSDEKILKILKLQEGG